ncbi:MAG: hypothetical protein KME42_08010 [Tildeniella nuda ZEHNDER 1965/U140]|nr:hypothetical protein [Tildeniella nuda ZEHNDER 1965/U140]
MARRRLSDMLREEANKPSDDEASAGAGQAADEPDADDVEVVDAEAVEETAAIAASASTKASTAAKSRSTKQTTAEPQTTPAPNQDKALMQKIADLTSALDEQKATIEQLQTDLEQTRKDARQLSDSNAKLTQELKTLQAQTPAVNTSALTKTAESHALQELKLGPSPVADPSPVATPENSLKTFNRDVGWFD